MCTGITVTRRYVPLSRRTNIAGLNIEQCLKFMFRIVNSSVPAIPPDKCFRSQRPSKRRVKPKLFTDYMTVNIIERHQNNNSRCFVVPAAHTDQFRNSYLVKTIVQWNTHSEPQVRAGTINEFSRLSCSLYSQQTPCALILS